MSLLLRDCEWIVTQNVSRQVLRNHSIYVEDGKIVEIAPRITTEAARVIDGRRKIVLPGLINTHTHLSMTLLRGYADDMPLHSWLEQKIWPMEGNLTADICYAGALLGCLEMIRTGTTCFMDMYFFVEDVARAVEEAGLKAFLSYAVIDSFDPQGRGFGQDSMMQLREAIEKPGGTVRFAVAPHAPYTCSPETMLKCKEVAEKMNCPIHVHIAETRREQVDFEKKYGMREFEYLDKIGFLCPLVVSAHSVWVTKGEVALMGKRGVKVAHCPVSNMKLAGGGVPPLPEMFASNVTVSLGTDGPASNNELDLFDTMKACALIHKTYRWDPTVLPADQVLDLATINGARALGIETECGSLDAGKDADIIMVDMRTPNLVPVHGKHTILSDLVYACSGYNVDTTIVRGRVLMHERRFETLNEATVMEKAQKAAEELLRKSGAQSS